MHTVKFVELLEQETTVALEPLPFIDNERLPARLFLEDDPEVLGIDDRLVSCDKNMELGGRMTLSGLGMEQFELLDDIAGLLFTVERNHSQLRSPSLELADPVRDGRVGNDNQRRERLELLRDGTEESGHLDGLAETHIVSQDAGLMIPPIVAQPVESIHLYES